MQLQTMNNNIKIHQLEKAQQLIFNPKIKHALFLMNQFTYNNVTLIVHESNTSYLSNVNTIQ